MEQTGIVFGVFDGLHEGHRYFLAQAQKHCVKLVVVLTLPQTSFSLKGREPKFSYDDRAKALAAFNANLEVIPSDEKPGTWSVLRERKNHMVILGYDQRGIASELQKMSVPYISVDAHHPEKYKSSLLNT